LVPGQEYEIRAVFWARGDFEIGGESGYGSRWNIAAGLTASDTKVFTAGFDYIKGDSTEYNTGVLSALPIIRPVLDAGYTLNETQVLLGTAIADGSGQIDAYVNGAAIDGLDPRTWYEGIAYQKAMLDIVETDGSTGVTNGTTDTFTVALSEDADGSDVVAEVYEVALADEIDIISGSTLTFTSGNYSTPQSVVVSGKTDELVNTSLVIKVSSNDPAFDDYMTTVYVEDFECGAKGYLALDFNLDCEVDLEDFATFATDWMKCTDPVYSGCTSGFDWE
jgi:hypothetical protein